MRYRHGWTSFLVSSLRALLVPALRAFLVPTLRALLVPALRAFLVPTLRVGTAWAGDDGSRFPRRAWEPGRRGKGGRFPRRAWEPEASDGFTLVEVLLVVAIVVIVAALVWPAMEKPLAYRRLHSAADEVRTEWCQARTEAMRSGRTYAFRYEVGGDHYYSEPDRGPEANTATGAPASASSTGGNTPSPADAAAPVENKTLPTGVKFLGQQPAENTTTAPSAASAQNQPAAGWSEPIFFYPDGTASDVQLILSCNQSYALRVMLRGSTATATVADAGSTLE